MQSIVQFFQYMNDVDFKYVVLRNWENLPFKVETGPHSDLDLLVYDLDHFLELFPDLERVYPEPRVQFKLYLDSGEYVQLDARHIGDGYYPDALEENILKTREWNPLGFWTPNPLHHRIGLAYHCVHHKNANTYPKYLGKLTVSDMLENMKQNENLAWTEPDDPSVGRFNSYVSGATSVVSINDDSVQKKQVRYKKYDLIRNEARILTSVCCERFPKVRESTDDSIRLEHCGAPLSASNLPDDWRWQLSQILYDLEAHRIVHRDIRLDNLMVKGDLIYLVDFGWARYECEEDGKHPDLLGYPNKCPLGFNDRYSMNRVIKQIEVELEEVCKAAS